MTLPLPGFRNLFHLLEKNGGASPAYEHILLPNQPEALETMSVLRTYGSLDAMVWRQNDPDLCSGGDHRYYSCLEHFYALSRVSDLLILPFQPVWDPDADYVWPWKPVIQLEERSEWLRSLGMREIEQRAFHPFYHEIVEVEEAPDPDEPISLLETLWPGFLLGNMLFCRAGVRIRAGAHVVRKDIAERSRLYWAYTRNNRQANDLSYGWGHNSQWATNFRRDYVADDAYYYNVDGGVEAHDVDLDVYGHVASEEDLDDPYNAPPVRMELLTHRCFIITPERVGEEYPYDLTYREPR